MSRDAIIAVNAGGVLMDRMLGYVAKHGPGEQERRGDRRLDDARVLIVENRLVIDSGDLQVIEERIASAREIKTGLDSKRGVSKLLAAREYHDAAISAYDAALTASEYFRYNPSFASSEASIDSYKTEKTINSRKSRYNALPRRKYADIALPHDIMSSDADVSTTVSEQHPRGSGPCFGAVALQVAVQNPLLIDSETSTEVTNTRKRLRSELKPKVATLVEYMYSFNTSQARASVFHNGRRAQELLRDMNFIYPEPRTGRDPYHHPIIQRAIDTTWFRNKDDIGVVNHENLSQMPISIIALTLTVIECCIDEWSDGTRRDSSWDDAKFETVYDLHVELLDFKARNPADVYNLQCDMLRKALEHAGVIEASDLIMYNGSDAANAANAGGVLKDRMLSYVTEQSPGEHEKRGDRQLDEARVLIVESHLVIDSGDLQVIEERIASAREIKTGLDSKRGVSKLLAAREYHDAAISAYDAALKASRRGRDLAYSAAQLSDTSSVSEMSDADRATGFALSLCRIYLSCKDAFPTPQIKEDWAEVVWGEACAKISTHFELFRPYELFADGNMKLFIETKKSIMHSVEDQYIFDAGHAPGSISSNAALAQALLSNMAFIYREPNLGGIPHHPYRHPALQKAINLTWFQSKDDDGVVFHEYFSPLSVPTIAFILTVIECCIDEWTDGTRKETEWDEKRFKTEYQSHTSLLNDFRQHEIAQGTDLFEHIRSGLLKEARKYAGVRPEPVTEFARFSRDALDAVVHREDSPAFPDQGFQLPEIRVVSDDSEE